jgi:hypothetical protein
MTSSSEVACFDAGSYTSFPLWTIDLFRLLHDSDVSATYRLHTVCAGLGPHHYEVSWSSSYAHTRYYYYLRALLLSRFNNDS